MDKRKLAQYLLPYCVSNNTQIRYEESLTYKNSFVVLRDSLMRIGFILLEDTEKNIYIVKIKSGILNQTCAYFALELKDNILNIAGCANEGVIFQNIYDKAIRKLIGGLLDENHYKE